MEKFYYQGGILTAVYRTNVIKYCIAPSALSLICFLGVSSESNLKIDEAAM